MAYKVIKKFRDLKDGNHIYEIGDDFPRSGAEVAAARIKELASSKNRIGVPLIEAVKVKVKPEPEPEPEPEVKAEAEPEPEKKKKPATKKK